MALPVARSSFFQPKQAPSTYFQAVRCYAASAGLNQDEVTGRIMDLLKNFDKVRTLRYETGAIANSICRSKTPQRYIHEIAYISCAHANKYLQLNAESHFHNDLGLDSLDTVEVVMAIEEVGRYPWRLQRATANIQIGVQH
jgi:hypothetical protein